MRFLFLLFAFLIVLIMGSLTALHNGSFIAYLDTHPDPDKVPPVAFFVAESYYIFGDLQNSATYYQRISERYPKSKYAEDSYFKYLRSLDDMNTPRDQMADLYSTYIERFPKGEHAEIVLKRIENCRNGR